MARQSPRVSFPMEGVKLFHSLTGYCSLIVITWWGLKLFTTCLVSTRHVNFTIGCNPTIFGEKYFQTHEKKQGAADQNPPMPMESQ